MEYYKILHLAREPFSNSPDPDFFYESFQHVRCLQKLELAIRLRRGLNVVIGDVGTGKTTLCRQLIRHFAADGQVETHLLLDPQLRDYEDFLTVIARMFGIFYDGPQVTEWQLKEGIKNYLYERSLKEEKLVVLIVDEGQRLPDYCFELLREFLNFETNDHKLLQIVIFAQPEFRDILNQHSGFADRINFSDTLMPLNFSDTRAMIRFRLKKASEADANSVSFSIPAFWRVYRATGGYPRKIITLCHQIVLTLIIQNRVRVNSALVRSCIRRNIYKPLCLFSWKKAAASLVFILLLFALISERYWFNIGITQDIQKKAAVNPVGQSETPAVPTGNEKLSQAETLKVAVKPEAGKLPVASGGVEALPEDGCEGGKTGEARIQQKQPESSVMKADEATVAAPAGYPHLLGKIRVRKNDIIWFMIEAVYGVADEEHLSGVAKANPGKNLDRVMVGAKIAFPAIPFKPSSSLNGRSWIKVAEKQALNEACDFIRSFSKSGPSLQIVPYWNVTDGLKFAVLVKKVFNDQESLKYMISTLPQELALEAESVSGWRSGTVFFGDVFFKS